MKFSLNNETVPTKDQKASIVADIHVFPGFYCFGSLAVLHSDQGLNFYSTLVHEIYNLLDIKKTQTNAYYQEYDNKIYTFLFLLCINDLPQALNTSSVSVYADDTSLCSRSKDLKELNKALNEDLERLDY